MIRVRDVGCCSFCWARASKEYLVGTVASPISRRIRVRSKPDLKANRIMRMQNYVAKPFLLIYNPTGPECGNAICALIEHGSLPSRQRARQSSRISDGLTVAVLAAIQDTTRTPLILAPLTSNYNPSCSACRPSWLPACPAFVPETWLRPRYAR